jgi:hypothetical protein
LVNLKSHVIQHDTATTDSDLETIQSAMNGHGIQLQYSQNITRRPLKTHPPFIKFDCYIDKQYKQGSGIGHEKESR